MRTRGAKRTMMTRSTIFTMILLSAAVSFGQPTLTYPADPWTTLDATDLNPNVPGANFAQIILPITVNSYRVTVTDANTWDLRVQYRDAFPTGVQSIEICRKDDGTSGAAGSYVNGTPAIDAWMTLTNAYQTLCTGFRNRNNIHLNLRVTITAQGLQPGTNIRINRLRFRVY
jgi:hypothetical protein